MNRAISLTLVLLAVTAALPAAAQESGGLRLHSGASATLNAIDANRGCPLSSTSVTVGVNKAFGTGSSAMQQLAPQPAATPNAGLWSPPRLRQASISHSDPVPRPGSRSPLRARVERSLATALPVASTWAPAPGPSRHSEYRT